MWKIKFNEKTEAFGIKTYEDAELEINNWFWALWDEKEKATIYKNKRYETYDNFRLIFKIEKE